MRYKNFEQCTKHLHDKEIYKYQSSCLTFLSEIFRILHQRKSFGFPICNMTCQNRIKLFSKQLINNISLIIKILYENNEQDFHWKLYLAWKVVGQ